jgi:hypothetical protein
VTAVRLASTMADSRLPVCHTFDPMAVVLVVVVELTRAGVDHEVRSVYRLAEAAARLLEQFGVEPAPVGVDLAPVIPLQRRTVDR